MVFSCYLNEKERVKRNKRTNERERERGEREGEREHDYVARFERGFDLLLESRELGR